MRDRCFDSEIADAHWDLDRRLDRDAERELGRVPARRQPQLTMRGTVRSMFAKPETDKAER